MASLATMASNEKSPPGHDLKGLKHPDPWGYETGECALTTPLLVSHVRGLHVTVCASLADFHERQKDGSPRLLSHDRQRTCPEPPQTVQQ